MSFETGGTMLARIRAEPLRQVVSLLGLILASICFAGSPFKARTPVGIFLHDGIVLLTHFFLDPQPPTARSFSTLEN